MKFTINIKQTEIFIMLFLLFLFSVSIFDLSGYLLILLFPMYFLLINKRKIRIDRGMMYLLIYSIMYFISNMIYKELTIDLVAKFLIAPWFMYIIGRDIVLKNNCELNLQTLIKIFLWGFFIHGVLNLYTYIHNYGIGYISSSHFRLTFDFWRNEPISVTVCSFYYLPMICYAIGYFFFGTNKKHKIIYSIGFAIGLYANLLYSNRTAIFIIAGLVLFALFILILYSKLNISKITIFFIVVLTTIFIINFDIYGVRTWILDLGITERLLSDDIGRFSVWLDFISSDWIRYPLGGYMVGDSYAHNLWLDTLRAVGILPFFSLLGFSFYGINIIKKYYKVYKTKSLPLIFMLIGIVLSFMVEPITDANPYYFLLTIMIFGGVKGFNVKYNMIERN